jgi:ketosteroid isomerase-like protein
MDDAQRLLIERACERLVVHYCHLVDHGQAARVADLFCEEGVWSAGGAQTIGREALRAQFQRRQDRTERTSRHVCCNLLLDVHDQDHASGVVYLTLYRHDATPGADISPLSGPAMVGEYRDAFERTPDGWRFARRELVIVFRAEGA